MADMMGSPIWYPDNNDPHLDRSLVRPMDRASPPDPHLPVDAIARKSLPVVTGVLDYFPDAIAEIAHLSKVGNDQHNPGEPLHWDKTKSVDHADALGRHLIDRGKRDKDGERHSAKVAWRALALLQTEIERERQPLETKVYQAYNPLTSNSKE